MCFYYAIFAKAWSVMWNSSLLTSQSISVSHSFVPDEDLHGQNIALLQSTDLREMTSLLTFKAVAMSLCHIVLSSSGLVPT